MPVQPSAHSRQAAYKTSLLSVARFKFRNPGTKEAYTNADTLITDSRICEKMRENEFQCL